MLFFSTGLVSVGGTACAMFVALPNLFGTDKRSHILSLLMTGFGLAAGIGFIGIGLTPWDLYEPQHNMCVNIGFRSLLLACSTAMINVYRTQTFPNLVGHFMVFVSLTLLSYIMLLTFGPSAGTKRGLLIQVGGQKVVAYVLVAGITVLACGALKVDKE